MEGLANTAQTNMMYDNYISASNVMEAVLLREQYKTQMLCFSAFYRNFVEMKEMTKRNM